MGRCIKSPATHLAGIKIPDELRLLSRKQAADYLGTGLDVFIGDDAPPALWIGPKTCRYMISDILAWAKHRIDSPRTGRNEQ
jgi:hypothetical protein